MLKELQNLLITKKYLIFDFDRTLAKMEIDWSEWHPGISQVYAEFDPNHGYEQGKNPHEYHNRLVKNHGIKLKQKLKKFNQVYEQQYLTGFTPNSELIDFVRNNTTHTLFVYSSNSRSTVLKGLEVLGIAEKFQQIISQDDVTYVKPDPEGFYLIPNFADHKAEFLMIGDSNADRGAAAAAGVDFLECNVFEKYAAD